MKETRNYCPRTILRILCIGILLIHLLMLGLGANAQTAKQKAVREIYTSQIGVREKQPNSGPEVERYLRYVGLPKGNAWCAAFVCWVFGEAGVGNPRSGWTPDLFKSDKVVWDRREQACLSGRQGTKSKEQRPGPINPHIDPHSNVNGTGSLRHFAYPPLAGAGGGLLDRKPGIPRTGDIFGLYFPEKGRIAHVGFIDEWDDQWVITVEGNTNMMGSREGDGVYRKRRLVRSIYQVARYVN